MSNASPMICDKNVTGWRILGDTLRLKMSDAKALRRQGRKDRALVRQTSGRSTSPVVRPGQDFAGLLIRDLATRRHHMTSTFPGRPYASVVQHPGLLSPAHSKLETDSRDRGGYRMRR
jgi:hypothetical protein